MKTKEQTIPKWFKGMIYDKGESVTNPSSGDSYELNGVELSMYDFIMGSQYVMEVAPKTVTEKQINEFHKALSWFLKNNSDAYMVLLD
jgi:riboflavin synthase alpha subunit